MTPRQLCELYIGRYILNRYHDDMIIQGVTWRNIYPKFGKIVDYEYSKGGNDYYLVVRYFGDKYEDTPFLLKGFRKKFKIITEDEYLMEQL